MAGLVGYASSDEDSGDEQPQIQAPSPQKQPQRQPSQPSKPAAPKPASSNAKPSHTQDATVETPTPLAAPPPSAAPLGPSLPPMGPSAPGASLPEPEDLSPPAAAAAGDNDAPPPTPSSPYTTARSLIHDLTLPSVPSFDIPPSPPGSPSPSALSTNKKFEQFLALKKNGTHFNAKLEQSAALRNPALTDKLLQFVDIGPPGGGGGEGGGGTAQYQTTLSEEVWNPSGFPDWAVRDKLRRAREKVAKEREAARAAPGRSSVEFVSGTTAAGGGGGGGGLSKGEKRKSGWQ